MSAPAAAKKGGAPTLAGAYGELGKSMLGGGLRSVGSVKRAPVVPTTLGLAGAVALTSTTLPVVGLATLCASPLVWVAVHRESFKRIAVPQVNAYIQRKLVYGRKWDEAMTHCGLMKRYGSEPRFPELLNVRCGEFFDEVLMRLLPGQHLGHAQEAAVALAATYGSDACRVRKVPRKKRQRHTRVRMDFQRHDALIETVEAFPVPDVVDLEAVRIGKTETGEPWCINLIGTHYLVGGATGSGKGSVLWSIVRGILPAVRDGLVELQGIDLKGGQELIHGRELFTHYVGEGADMDECEALLAALVERMKARSSAFAESRERKFTPTLKEPLVLLVFDEMADATTCSPKSQRDRINGYLAMLCRRGRSVGITALMLLQDPRMEAVPFRRQIPHGIGLRLSDQFEVDAVCGPGSFKAGARCTEIPGAPEPSQPIDGRGVAFFTTLGEPTPTRVRASYVRDEDLAAMVQEYAPLNREAVEAEFDVEGEDDMSDDRPRSRP